MRSLTWVPSQEPYVIHELRFQSEPWTLWVCPHPSLPLRNGYCTPLPTPVNQQSPGRTWPGLLQQRLPQAPGLLLCSNRLTLTMRVKGQLVAGSCIPRSHESLWDPVMVLLAYCSCSEYRSASLVGSLSQCNNAVGDSLSHCHGLPLSLASRPPSWERVAGTYYRFYSSQYIYILIPEAFRQS